MRLLSLAAALCAASAAGAAQGAPPAPPPVSPLKLDAETQIGSAGVACTGVGQTKSDPHWLEYPIRVEFSDASNAYLVDGEVVVRAAGGRPLLHLTCEGPWLLLKLPPGAYSVEGRLATPGVKPRSARFTLPVAG